MTLHPIALVALIYMVIGLLMSGWFAYMVKAIRKRTPEDALPEHDSLGVIVFAGIVWPLALVAFVRGAIDDKRGGRHE